MNTKETKAVQISSNDMEQLCGGRGFSVVSSGKSLKNELKPFGPINDERNWICNANCICPPPKV